MNGEIYCPRCARLGDAASANCPHCGVPRDQSRSGRAAGVAFVLNEVDTSPLSEIITTQQRARIATHYEEELRELVRPASQRAAPRAAAPVVRAPAPPPAPASTAPPPPAPMPAPMPMRAAAPVTTAATPRRPAVERKPTDWSWLAEQQANLFLFAGAFLTVVAALIYVGYSGNAVDGSLKMALLIAYTLAFLAAGIVCLRIPRVAIAGQVFFGVGALLVPLNFVAARSVLTDESLNPETMWLAGSATTAAFYTAVAWLGVGRRYSFGAGVAFVSAMMAAVVRLDMAPEWAPMCFLALAAAMAVASIAGPATLRARAGYIWSMQAHVIAGGAIGFALVAAPFALSSDVDFDVSTLWYLPITFVALTAYAALPTLVHKQQLAGIALIGAFSGAVVSIAYALDVAAEEYAVGFAALAVILGALAFPAASARWSARLPERFGGMLRDAGVGATLLAAGVVLLALQATADVPPYIIDNRWFTVAAAALVLVFYGADAFGRRERLGAPGAALALAALCGAWVYALDISPEYYAFALIAPAIALACAVRWAPAAWTRRLAPEWRDDVMLFGRTTTATGVAVALAAAISGEGSPSTYTPQFRAFLPVAFAAAAVFFAIDASRTPRAELSAALMLALTGAIVSVAYAFDTDAAYYGAAFAVAGAIFAVGGRAWSPAWLDKDVRDMAGAGAFTIAWLAFEPAYRDETRVGAVVHLAAAAFYALAAMFQKSDVTLARLIDLPVAARVRATTGWLYAAGLAATLGYLHFLNSLPGDETIDDTLRRGYPMMAVTLAFAALGIVVSRLRPEFRMHFYVMSLAAALVSLATPVSAEALSIILTVYVATSLVLAVFENEPLMAAPAGAFGFAAIGAWGVRLDASDSMAPIAFMSVALVSAAAAGALRKLPRWTLAAGACAAMYAVAAPATGFVMLASQTHDGDVGSAPFYETALYEWSTISVALVGMLALAGAAVVQRRWIIVPASAVLATALLLQIGRFDPGNPQAYTLVIGAYLVLLGLLGLWKFRLVPELADAAPWIEAAGAAFIMLPSMVQSLQPGGGRYEWIVLTEAVAFFAGSIVLRRRGMLGASIVALVLVAGRVLFDTVNALPNWVVVMVAGMALLGVGMGILLGRERWSNWQEALLGWWANGADAPVH